MLVRGAEDGHYQSEGNFTGTYYRAKYKNDSYWQAAVSVRGNSANIYACLCKSKPCKPKSFSKSES